MRYKLTAAAFFHAAALGCFAFGCSRAPQPAGSVAAQATPAPAATVSATRTPAVTGLCPEGAQTQLPPPAGYVNDHARVIDDATRQRLEGRLARLKEQDRIELAVVTVETTGEWDAPRYSLDLARCWGVGSRAGEEGGGLLLLVAVKDRKWHIQVSRSLERDLPDPEVAVIGSRMRPHFASAAYAQGIEAAVDSLIKHLQNRGR